jgi:hypothetical protein
MTEPRTIDSFDRLAATIDGLPGVDRSRPTTVTTVTPILGVSQTYVVQTYKTEDGFVAFIQTISAEGSIRIALPAKVTAALYRQRDALVTTSRKRRARDAWDNLDPDQREARVAQLRTGTPRRAASR